MDFWTQILLVMALLNFTLNIASVHLGWWKRRNLGTMMEHIVSHVCPNYPDDEMEFHDEHMTIPQNVFLEDWISFAENHIQEHGRLPNNQDIEAHFNTEQAQDMSWKDWEEQE
jgi:hypothetical protein